MVTQAQQEQLGACKAFQKHGSEQAGVTSHFAVHLRNSPVKLASFRGN